MCVSVCVTERERERGGGGKEMLAVTTMSRGVQPTLSV